MTRADLAKAVLEWAAQRLEAECRACSACLRSVKETASDTFLNSISINPKREFENDLVCKLKGLSQRWKAKIKTLPPTAIGIEHGCALNLCWSELEAIILGEVKG